MSPRAAWQLESMGFEGVHDYVAGKDDWLSNNLPVEGEADMHDHLFAGDAVQRDVPTCYLGERLGPVRERVQQADGNTCVVLNREGVVLGRLRSKDFEAAPETQVEGVMEVGPTTTRPGTALEDIAERMKDAQVDSILVTTAEGRFLGELFLEDAERKLRG